MDAAVSAAAVLVFWVPPVLALDGGGQRLLGATAAGWAVSATTDPMIGAAWCLYPLALQHRSRKRAAGPVAVGVLVAAALVLGISVPEGDPVQRAVFGLGAIGAAWLLARSEAERAAAVRRAERGRVEAEQARREAAMAREVHDIVGHALSTISAEAGVARAVSHSDKGEMLEALEDIEHRSRAALEEVQALVRSLRRRDRTALGGGRGAAALRELVAAAKVSGVDVDARIDLPECRDETVLAATRVAQEALSNMVRHAAAERCELMVAPVGERLVVRVDDDGRGIPPGGRAGSGIAGMRERAESVGGRLTVSDRPGGGTRVLAELPLPAQD
ncbi:sensor histidine kinase [Nocardiopsis potens]|uniref:sensor histidine kinase n=1 Tax=Nocardiopsis potens TaxID=1246458 RepID=UPI000348EA4F|nr:ATP-binding protein [Nocardiopsis potens]